ncbi:hypothetical protein D3C72_658730 [compost metagenome]
MLALAVDLHPVAARADGVRQRLLQVQRGAHLVEIRHLEVAAVAHRAAVRRQLAQDQAQQRGLAHAVGADHADLVATHDGAGEVTDHRLVAVGLRHVDQFGHDLAGAVRLRHLQPHIALHLAPRRALGAHGHQPLDTRHAARAARFHALADPHFLLRQQLVELGLLHCLGGQQFGLAGLVGREVAREGHQPAPVQFDDAGGHAVQEGAIVGNQQHAAPEADQQVFEPADGGDVEVVGRFVEQQDVRLGHQPLRQRHALLQAAGQRIHAHVRIQAEAGQRGFHAGAQRPGVGGVQFGLYAMQLGQRGLVVMGVELGQRRLVAGQQVVRGAHAQAHRVEHGQAGRELWLLRHICSGHAALAGDQAIVRGGHAGHDPQQRRLARAIAADQANAFAGFQRKIGVVEQCHVPEGELGIGNGEQGHGAETGNRPEL